MPQADYLVHNHGSLFILEATHPSALDNILDNTSEETQRWGNGIAVEPRYIVNLVNQLREEGWTVV